MITFQKVTRKFEDTVALDSVDLEFYSGQIVGLLGLNGAGKTTLLRILTGTLSPTTGTVSVGTDGASPDSVEAKQQIGYLPEHCPLYDDMLLGDYLVFIAGLRNIPSQEQQTSVHAIASILGLVERMHQPIHTLSKGYRQRVGLAQALVHRPKIAILDEPTSGLDPQQMEDIRALIRSLSEDTTVILSTHNLHEVEALCDRVVILVRGKVGADMDLQALKTKGRGLTELFKAVHSPSAEDT